MAAYRNRRSRRCGYGFEAINLEGTRLFTGASSNGRQSIYLANQEAMIKAKEADLSRIIILNNCKRTEELYNNARVPTWQEHTFVFDTRQLMQQGLSGHLVFVPKVIISHVLELVNRTTRFPMHVYNLCINSK